MAYRSKFINPEAWKQANVGQGERMAQDVFQPENSAADAALQGLAGQRAHPGSVQGNDPYAAANAAASRLTATAGMDQDKAYTQRYGRRSTGGAGLDAAISGGPGSDSPYARAAAAATAKAGQVHGAVGDAREARGVYENDTARIAKEYADKAALDRHNAGTADAARAVRSAWLPTRGTTRYGANSVDKGFIDAVHVFLGAGYKLEDLDPEVKARFTQTPEGQKMLRDQLATSGNYTTHSGRKVFNDPLVHEPAGEDDLGPYTWSKYGRKVYGPSNPLQHDDF